MNAIAAAYNYYATTNVNAGDVVIWDSATAYAVKTTNSQGSTLVAGVAVETVSAGNECTIRQDGGRVLLNVTGSVDIAVNPFMRQSSSTGLAEGVANLTTGVFARAITNSGVPAAGQVYASLNLAFLGYGGEGGDADAYHYNVPNEFADASQKSSPVSADRIPIEDSEDSWNKKYAELGDLPGGGGGVTDHGELTGLGDDDHTQYHNNTRGDARYLYRENTTPFTPDADYEPATKKYVDDNGGGGGGGNTYLPFEMRLGIPDTNLDKIDFRQARDSMRLYGYRKHLTTDGSTSSDLYLSVQLPSTFSAPGTGNNINIDVYKSDADADCSIILTVYDSAGTADAGVNGATITPSANATWETKEDELTSDGNYSAGEWIVIKISVTLVDQNDEIRIGTGWIELTLS